jgi:hypothetical protein
MMKKILFVLASLAVLAGCHRNEPEDLNPAVDVTGSWELSAVTTRAMVGGEQVSVYLVFSASGSFDLYQKIGEGRYTHFTGSYSMNKDEKLLSGTYADGTKWGPYEAALEGTTLSLNLPGGKEVDSYKKIDAVPESVTGNVY